MFELLVTTGLGYAIGSVPSAAWLARLKGKAIFDIGSGSMGAMNTARNVGWTLGILVLVADTGKGVFATSLARRMASLTETDGLAALAFALTAGVGAVAGHAWSMFAGFKGGKALATTFGVALPVYPLAALYALIVLVGLILLSRRVVLASVITALCYPFVVLATLWRQGHPQDTMFSVFTSVMIISSIVLIKHIPDLRRGEERLF
ncbi:MAG: glycerol-3-phosphate acyltransferase [Trueperaceae bacterium]|nr:MAG: glycerol-3-phosphate acyltransferase [Trueperaceae bacterium]